MGPNEFIENGKPFLYKDGYSTCRMFFYSNKGQLNQEEIASEAIQMLSAYLEQKGHFRSLNSQKGELIAYIIAFVSENPAPFDWKVKDGDFAEKLYDLYSQLQNICQFEQKNQLLIITRIISVIYGCCPAFTPQLLALLNLPLDTQDALLCFTTYQQLSLVPWLLAALIALNNPNANDSVKAWANETLHAILEDIEKRNNNTNHLLKI